MNRLLAGGYTHRSIGRQGRGLFIYMSSAGGRIIRKVANYRSVAGSYGFQAGVQTFGYAMFLMTDAAVQYLNRSDGWELGVGPSIVVVDVGIARTLTTSTIQSDIYAFIFDQKGLMAGVGIQGSKITRVNH